MIWEEATHATLVKMCKFGDVMSPMHAVALDTAPNAQQPFNPIICTTQQYVILATSRSMLRDQLNHLGCRNDTLGIAIIDGTYSNLVQDLINLWSWHSVASANILEDTLDAIGRDGGLCVVLTGGTCGLDDVLSESTGEFHCVAGGWFKGERNDGS